MVREAVRERPPPLPPRPPYELPPLGSSFGESGSAMKEEPVPQPHAEAAMLDTVNERRTAARRTPRG